MNSFLDNISVFKNWKSGSAIAYGLPGSAKAAIILRLVKESGCSVLVITSTEDECISFYRDLRFFASIMKVNTKVLQLAAVEIFENDLLQPDYSFYSQRMEVLDSFSSGENTICVASVIPVMQKVILESSNNIPEFVKDSDVDMDATAEKLTELGYQRADIVRRVGEYSIRGCIIDIFPPAGTAPFRVELFGDTIESIREFDIYSQMSTIVVDSFFARGLSTGEVSDAAVFSSIFNHLDEDVRLAYNNNIFKAAQDSFSRISRFQSGKKRFLDFYIGDEELEGLIKSYSAISFEPILAESSELAESFTIEHQFGSLDKLNCFRKPSLDENIDSIELLILDHQVVLVCKDTGELVRLKELLAERDIIAGGSIESSFKGGRHSAALLIGDISGGFALPGIVVAATSEIFGKRAIRKRERKPKKEVFLSSFDDLKVGGHIVHVDYGIGLYTGLERIGSGENTREYLKLEYDKRDVLYVPVENLDYVQKYISADGSTPKLNKLGGTAWSKTQGKAKKAVEEVVEGLLELYSSRKVISGLQFLPDDHAQMEFESLFEFEETTDQMNAIFDVKNDMESSKVMDRLVCGDVGYGKTEVILRAAFKAVNSGLQVAILVPTTLLAFQHFRTFSARFSMFSIKVEMMSRFRTAKEHKQILEGLGNGDINIVIGTHKLLQKDCKFDNLGLLVIDEEQKFGVRHKEKLRDMKKNLDVLTLTATPIPRTLQMSLFGMRDISTIATPPVDRRTVKTHIIKFDTEIIKDAILKEVMRGGQVFFIHNRVKNITQIGNKIQEMVPDIKIGIAHGQMGERELESVVMKFIEKEYHLLLATSIIESGIDIPDANTIIINRADMFGLSDLYQIRGRVGRSVQQAYAYLIVPGGEKMSSSAVERISAIADCSGAGAGFQISMKDLEIRGAGHLLGSSQSGQMAGVGFEMFMKMIDESVKKKQGSNEVYTPEPEINIGFSTFIPEKYIPQVQVRLNLYKRLSSVSGWDELTNIKLEIKDRFGKPPEHLEHLFYAIDVKLLAKKNGIVKIDSTKQGFTIRFDHNRKPTDKTVDFLMSNDNVALLSEYSICLQVSNKEIEFVEQLKKFLADLDKH